MFGVNVFVESDEDCFSRANCGSSEIARWTEHRACDVVDAFGAFFDVELGHFRPLGHDDLVRLLGQRQGVVAAQLLFSSVGLFAGGEFFLRKEPLRFGATRSVTSVIVPVDGLGHAAETPLWTTSL